MKFVFLMTKITLILTLNDSQSDPKWPSWHCRSFDTVFMSLFHYVALAIWRSLEPLPFFNTIAVLSKYAISLFMPKQTHFYLNIQFVPIRSNSMGHSMQVVCHISLTFGKWYPGTLFWEPPLYIKGTPTKGGSRWDIDLTNLQFSWFNQLMVAQKT